LHPDNLPGVNEYYIGLEGLRFLLFGISEQLNKILASQRMGAKTIFGLLPNLLVLIGFMFWRTQIFKAERLDINRW